MSTEETNQSNNLKTIIYPNPFTDNISLKILNPNNTKEISCVFENSLGQILSSSTNKTNVGLEQTIKFAELPNLSSGIYFISIRLDGVLKKTIKVVK